MERITYLLGAGFSAPLGLPVMSNFIEKSKDLYFDPNNGERYKYFKNVLETINKISTIKNYYNADLYNIEEILSILETSDLFSLQRKRRHYINYLIDTISAYTPEFNELKMPAFSAQLHRDFVFQRPGVKNADLYNHYALFVANLFRLHFAKHYREHDRRFIRYSISREDDRNLYSIITLNYDLVLENLLEAIKKKCSRNEISFDPDVSFVFDKYNSDWINPHLVKLHGCVSKKNIIPPTWAKGISKAGIKATWETAYHVLLNSTQIRIIGYSLPITDAYIKYLLKAAAIEAPHLKRVDIITKDNNDLAKKRYDDFINFNTYSFKNDSFENYLSCLYDNIKDPSNIAYTINKLEKAHSQFMGRS